MKLIIEIPNEKIRTYGTLYKDFCDPAEIPSKERDADMSPVFMRAPKSCLYYSQINEPEIPLT